METYFPATRWGGRARARTIQGSRHRNGPRDDSIQVLPSLISSLPYAQPSPHHSPSPSRLNSSSKPCPPSSAPRLVLPALLPSARAHSTRPSPCSRTRRLLLAPSLPLRRTTSSSTPRGQSTSSASRRCLPTDAQRPSLWAHTTSQRHTLRTRLLLTRFVSPPNLIWLYCSRDLMYRLERLSYPIDSMHRPGADPELYDM